MAFSVDRYSDFKAKGIVALVKLGAAYAWSLKRFDAATGETLPPEVGALDIAEVVKQRDAQAAVVKQYDVLIADLKALG